MLLFDETKFATLNLRISPKFKKSVQLIAERETRSTVNALECLVIDYFDRNGLTEADRSPVLMRKTAEAARARR
jgi:hypothetical protein